MCRSVAFFFFFSSRRRHTRLQGDWSSDVCSSDLDDVLLRSARAGWPGPPGAGHRPRPEPPAARSWRGGHRTGEGRGGEEGRFRGGPDHLKKKKKRREGRCVVERIVWKMTGQEGW